jgi:acetylornithine/succinyldiaminopimelate/putrescine aminotransferase
MASLAVVKALMNDGLLTVAAGPLVVRWLPPLNVSTDEINTALAIMRRTLDRMANGGK